jgi:myosin protein heavy chain
MSLEAEKRKVEEELEAERGLAVDKDALLERSKKRESELEDEVAALQGDVDLLDSQLDRALKLQKESEEKHENLRQMFDQAAEHLVRLEIEQKEWAAREEELNAQLLEAQQGSNTMRTNLDELHKVGEELRNLVLQREEDLARAKERTDITVKELEGKLEAELRNTCVFLIQIFNWRLIVLQGNSQAQDRRAGAEWTTSPTTACRNGSHHNRTYRLDQAEGCAR